MKRIYSIIVVSVTIMASLLFNFPSVAQTKLQSSLSSSTTETTQSAAQSAVTKITEPLATRKALNETQLQSRPVDPIVLSNQMMITIAERIKAGAYDEARKIAQDMIFGHEKFIDSPQGVYRTFASRMGKKYFEEQMKKEGRQEPVIWVEQPIADGFYFLAIIDFQEKKPKEALENIQRAIQWDPTRASFYIERGFILLNQEQRVDLAEVAASYLKALELADEPVDFAAALRGLGYVFVEQNDWEGALACYLVSLHFDPQSEAAKKELEFIKYNQPELFQKLDANAAIQALNRRKVPVKIDPIHVEILLKIADELSPKTQANEIKAILKRALLLDPKNEVVKKRLAAMK